MRLDGFKQIADALGHRSYATYISGNSISLVGLWVQRVAVGWLTWELTGSGAWLGIVAFADLFPSVFIGPIAGAIADRSDRVRIMLTTQTLLTVQASALCVLSASGWISVHSLVALVLLNGIVVGFNQPARLALVATLVPREHLATAVAINSIVFNLARFLGPALAGLLILAGGVSAAFLVNALSYLVFIFSLRQIRHDVSTRAESTAAASEGSLFGAVWGGVRYVTKHPGIAALLCLVTATAVGLRPYMELLPGFAADVYEGGAGTLALLTSAIGIGAVIGGFWVAQRTTPDLTRIVLSSSLLATVSLGLFAVTDRLALAVVWVVGSGVFIATSGIAAQTLIQTAVDSTMRARVLSLYGVIFRAGPALGALVMGLGSEFVGLRWPLLVGALLSAAVWLWVWQRRHALRTPG
jgi:predicted MFS family arabinose efflux permease